MNPLLWFAAVTPVLLLFGTVASGRCSARVGAVLALATTLLVATTVFGLSAVGVAVGLGKGAWLGLWILLVVGPALLVYRIVAAVGFERIGGVLSGLLPGRCERLLVVAWLFPSFVQGVAGFGTPVAVAAPLLLAMGWNRVRAVALPLVGYHWSVTFGSMGSSFYVASLTAGFDSAQQGAFAVRAASFAALNCLVAGALVLLMDGGRARLREGLPLLLRLGLPTAVALVAVAAVVPAIATLVAGTVGLGMLWLTTLRRRLWAGRRPTVTARAAAPRTAGPRTAAPGVVATPAAEPAADPAARSATGVTSAGTGGTDGSAGSGGTDSGVPADGTGGGSGTRGGDRPAGAPLLLCPYLFLLLTALPVFLVPRSREWVKTHALVGPAFPATHAARGWSAAAVEKFNPVAVFGHPGFYILLAAVLGYAVYRRTGLLGRRQAGRILGGWVRALPASSVVIVCLTAVAMVMADAGMISVLARGTEAAAGPVFPALSPAVGALGSFMTGSTTSSNALLAAFQAQVAGLLGTDPTVLVAAQTTGSNVGNSLSPVVVLIGLSAVGASQELAPVLRRCLWPAAVLLSVLVTAVLVSVALHGSSGHAG